MTDRPDLEPMLERRLLAYAATVSRPFRAEEVARATVVAAASTPATHTVRVGGPRRPALLVGLAAALLLAAVAGTAFVGGLPGPIQGSFVEGPSIDQGRIVSAVMLPDGRVLVGIQPIEDTVPGTTTLDCSTPCRPQMAFIDPRTEAVTMTAGPPPSAAVGSPALLHDGRVLLLDGSPAGAAATIYDPATDRFEIVGAPSTLGAVAFLVTLADGRVLVGGDTDSGATAAEVFDPATGSFTTVGSMSRERGFGTSAVLLGDGRVFVAGGGPEVGASAELFDPASGTFTPTESMTIGRGGFFSATVLRDGRVLVAGGLVPDPDVPTIRPSTTATAEIYDPRTGRFTAVGSMAGPRYGHAASLLRDGTVLLAGGSRVLLESGTPVAVSDAEIFDPATGTFRATGSMNRPRLLPAVAAPDDRVLILGNFDPLAEDPGTGATSEWFD